QAKFTPLELRELDHSPNVEVIVEPEDIEYDEGSLAALRSDNQTRLVVKELERYASRDRDERPRKLYLHFFENPVEVTGDGRVEGFRTERTEYKGDGNTVGTGVFHDWPVQAVYRAVGYKSSPLPDLPWDEQTWTVPHDAGRVLDADGHPVPGLYVNGWIKRGPVGLIGHTKGDAIETVGSILTDLEKLPVAPEPSLEAVTALLDERGLDWTTWESWLRLDAHELALGEAYGPVLLKDGTEGPRERVKVVDRDEMLAAQREGS
ncbi:MAG: fpr, partial [Frankiales bacterium]|nr:fpr [Frankiales bacterium]